MGVQGGVDKPVIDRLIRPFRNMVSQITKMSRLDSRIVIPYLAAIDFWPTTWPRIVDAC
jgi:hypothetical protein